MTNDQIEAAARKLCELRGLDPDKSISGVVSVPRWHLFFTMIREMSEVLDAIAHAREAATEASRKWGVRRGGIEWVCGTTTGEPQSFATRDEAESLVADMEENCTEGWCYEAKQFDDSERLMKRDSV